MGATIRDVARLAGVSPATVSRYFQGTDIVADASSRKIEKAAKALRYVPVHKKKSIGIIAIVVSNFNLVYYQEALKILFETAKRYNYNMMLIPIRKEGEEYKVFFKDLNITGVIYLEEDIPPAVTDYISAKNIKTLVFGGVGLDKRSKMVHINDLAAAHEGARFLLRLKHTKILILSDFPHSISSGFQRITGCKRAYEEKGLRLDESLVKYGDLSYDSGYFLTMQAYKEQLVFTAVFAFSDEMALGAMRALDDLGIEPGREVSVLGFDGLSISRQSYPKLCTIEQPLEKMAEIVLDTFLSTQPEENIEVTLPFRISVGGTCKENTEMT